MSSPVILLIMIIGTPVFLMFWNKFRTHGKMLCYFLRKDKSIVGGLCVLKSSFVIWTDRAFDVYPDFIRVARFPMGWPSLLQELVPCALYDEEDAVPKDWITLESPKDRSMEVRAALDENWLRKLVQEAAREGGGFQFNWRRVLPIALVIVGVIGLIYILMSKGCSIPGVK